MRGIIARRKWATFLVSLTLVVTVAASTTGAASAATDNGASKVTAVSASASATAHSTALVQKTTVVAASKAAAAAKAQAKAITPAQKARQKHLNSVPKKNIRAADKACHRGKGRVFYGTGPIDGRAGYKTPPQNADARLRVYFGESDVCLVSVATYRTDGRKMDRIVLINNISRRREVRKEEWVGHWNGTAVMKHIKHGQKLELDGFVMHKRVPDDFQPYTAGGTILLFPIR